MPSSTAHYGLKIYDREIDKTQYFIDFREALAGTNNSNMIKIDEALFKLSRSSSPYEDIITGDGVSKDFLVPEYGIHGKNTLNPVVTLIDMENNTPVITKWKSVSVSQILISFKSILPNDKKYKVIID